MHDLALVAPSPKKFGYFFTALFIGLATLRWNSQPGLAYTCATAGVLFAVSAWRFPKILQPLNLLWFRLGLMMSAVVSPIVLGVLFYGLITPWSLFLKLCGMDLLRLKWDAKAPSYWLKKEKTITGEGSPFDVQY